VNHDRTEQLIRDVFADEAARAGDPREVLAAVRGRRPRRSYGLVLTTAAVVVVVAAVATFVVPEVFRRSTPPATEQQRTVAAAPTSVLVVGVDGNDNTDAVVLAQVGEDGATSLISLPRDSWVATGGTMARLNQIYKRSGITTLLTAVRDLTGVPVDHYAVVDTVAVVTLTDAVGGVPVCLNAATSDPFSGADFRAGEQVVTGDAALAFIRQRHGLPNGDLDRIARLQAFLRSLVVELDGDHLPTLLATVQGHVRTDPDLDVAGILQVLAGDNEVHVGTIPVADELLTSPDGGQVLGLDPAEVKRFVTELPGTPPATGGVPCVN
jgi:LCP family protein required for cell wall assembly